MPVSNINPGNKSLEFIETRIGSEKYRGDPSSEHNRYDMVKVLNILTLLNKYAPGRGLMSIRTTDISKRPKNNPDEFTYARFCNEAKQKTGIGTQDAMRKNLFPDFHKMGFIVRYNKNEEKIDYLSRQKVKFVSISNQGLKFIRGKTILDKYFIFSKGVNDLIGGYIDIILDILRYKDFVINKISIYEFMFFISAIGAESSFNINTDKAVELIKEYRNLTSIQRRSVIETLRAELDPKIFSGSKNKKRDFHNWWNKIKQIYNLLNQTVYFEVRGEYLVLKGSQKNLSEASMQLARSLNEKNLYFVNHKVNKTLGFEVHHIVPLSWSENIYHLKILDKWENMVYIDAFSHAKITQNKNRNVRLETTKEDIILSDYLKNEVYLRYPENILYAPTNKKTLKDYNGELLNTINII